MYWTDMLNVRIGLPFGSDAAQATTIQKPTSNDIMSLILGGCVSLAPESYIQYRDNTYLLLPPHVV